MLMLEKWAALLCGNGRDLPGRNKLCKVLSQKCLDMKPTVYFRQRRVAKNQLFVRAEGMVRRPISRGA